MESTLSSIFARFIHDLTYDDLPTEVINKTKTLFLHGLGVGLAAYDTETAQIAIEITKREGPAEATIMIDGGKVNVGAAAFVNGTMFHSRIQEDEYQEGSMHPGVVIIPAALGTSEKANSTGKELIVALASGYEVATRLSRNFGGISVSRGFRATPVYGGFGAAVAGAKLLNFEEKQIGFSIGWTANMSSGLLQCGFAKTSEMPFQAGLASRNGVVATKLAQANVSTAGDILEGEKGFYSAFCGEVKDLGKVVNGLGHDYEMLRMQFKRFPVCWALQNPMYGMLRLVNEHDVDVGDIDMMRIHLSPAAANYPGVNSLEPGLMSAQYCLAVACVHRKCTLQTLADTNNFRVRHLMSRISVVADGTLTKPMCKIYIKFKNGSYLPRDQNPISAGYSFDLHEERVLIESLIPEMPLPAERMKQIIELIEQLEGLKSVEELVQATVFPGTKGKRIKLPI